MTAKEGDLCPRTLCIYKPGVPMGVKCMGVWTGKIPATGRKACMTCGRTLE